MMMVRTLAAGVGLACVCAAGLGAAESPGQVKRLMTEWGARVTPENTWREYPRPQMARDDWLCLNGQWDCAITEGARAWSGGRVENAEFDLLTENDVAPPDTWQGTILVPYAIESTLSGVQRLVRPHQILWYRRAFEVPEAWKGRRVRINFEAVDWHAVVWVKGRRVGENKGGYVPFSFDLTDALRAHGPQEVIVGVWDPTNAGDQSIGKQALPEIKKGFRYEPTTGIWQSVWLEPVAETRIDRLVIVPQEDLASVSVQAMVSGAVSEARVGVRVMADGTVVSKAEGAADVPLILPVPNARRWSPDAPYLYDLEVAVKRAGEALDTVKGYFGMRWVDIAPDEEGIPRIRLNGEPIFQFGPLDQGYWPDGGLTPPSDDAARADVAYLKSIGCNMARVHIKVHPARWYHWCDRLGLLVWQDFVCTRKFESRLTQASKAQWEDEQRRLMEHLRNHPSVVHWIVFNEGWGQYDTDRLTQWVKDTDPSRIVSSFSGWTDTGTGQIHDTHDYTYFMSPSRCPESHGRASVIGECGGFNVAVPGHTWYTDAVPKAQDDFTQEKGRNHYLSGDAWLPRYRQWIETLRALRFYGVNAAVYTQITDVEHELNGWLTYDRAVSKIPASILKPLHNTLYRMPNIAPVAEMISFRSSDSVPQNDAWIATGFDDSSWQELPLPAPHPKPKAPLSTAPSMCRLTFELAEVPDAWAVRLVGNHEFDIYLNGTLMQRATNHNICIRDSFSEEKCPLEEPVSISVINPDENTRRVLTKGRNVLAVKYTGPALYDVGLIDIAD